MRRNAFESLNELSDDPPKPSVKVVPKSDDQAEHLNPSSPLDFIPNAATKKKRSRTWEKSRQDQVVTYRGIPPEVREGLASLAQMLDVPVDEIARAFLEFGVAQYQSGGIRLNPLPKAQRMTLFSQDGKVQNPEKEGWLKNEFRRERKPKNKKKANEPKTWEHRVSFRIPPEVKESVKEIAERHSVPVGEVALFFFNDAHAAFQAGQLVLSPQPKSSGNTLF
jgi:hypothetical protein